MKAKPQDKKSKKDIQEIIKAIKPLDRIQKKDIINKISKVQSENPCDQDIND